MRLDVFFREGSVIVRYAVITTTTVEDDDRSNVLKEAVESMEIVERNSVEVAGSCLPFLLLNPDKLLLNVSAIEVF